MAAENEWLERIVLVKQAELEQARARVPQSELEKRVQPGPAGVFRRALLARCDTQPDIAIIAELKHASPSRGTFRSDYNPATIARSYQQAGARALSVLTDRKFFLGLLDHLQQAKAATSLPILRKDFTLAEYHVFE